MRPPANHGDNRQTNISIHAPARGATPGLSVDHVGHQISIHAPARGATYRSTVTEETPTITIHAPARGATGFLVVLHASVIISIHAPARGATTTARWNYALIYRFQSTHPRGVRQQTQPIACLSLLLYYSIFYRILQASDTYKTPVTAKF